jgi:hypothetical protein
MPTPRLKADKRKAVIALAAQGFKQAEIAKKAGVATGTVANVLESMGPSESPMLHLDKKRGKFNWRNVTKWIEAGKELKNESSWSQDFATIKLGDGSSPVIFAPFSDQHVGSWGSDHGMLEKITDEILRTPNLFLALLGDYAEFAIKMRSVLEVTSQVIPPDMQVEFLEDWLTEIAPRVAFATWCNHGVEREEVGTGVSSIKRVLSRTTVYANGIAHVDLQVGDQVYKVAASHVFKQGRSTMNPLAGQMRYMRFQGLDRELCIQGDTHTPGLIQYMDGPLNRVCLNAGTLHVNSGYAKRYFSLFTSSAYPCVVLHPDKHRIVPYWSIEEAAKSIGVKPGRRV